MIPRTMRAAYWALLLAAVVAALPAEAQVRRAKGWVREPAHVKASIPLMLRFQNYLPEEVDLSASFPTPGDQGQQSSCTAWATGYAMRSYYEGVRRKWTFSSPRQIISPAYIYNRLHDFGGNCDAGTSISDALELLKADGAPPLAAYPYIENDCARPATADIVRTGSQFRIAGWTALNNKRLDDAKGQLALGNPVVFGMEVSDKFENLGRGEFYDDISSPRTGGHAMVLVGYSERRQAFKVMNSWGTAWGDGGFAWISYRAVRALSDLMFVMEVPEYVPPKPAPRPAPPEPVTPPSPPPAPVVTPPAPVVVVPPAPKPAPEPKPQPQPAPPAPVVVTPPVVTPPKPAPDPVVTPPKPVVVAPPVTPPKPEPVVKPQPSPPAPKPGPIPSVATVRAQVAARAGQLACARIESSVDANRSVRLRGFAGAAADLGRLESDVRAMPGVRGVRTDVTIRPWPQCEVYLNFANELKTPRGLSAALRGASARAFVAGDSLAIEVVTPSYPSYLYVTYLQTSGDAVNLYWPQGKFPKALPPKTRITFGGGGTEPVYRIAAPFGDEIVVVVASASPLFQDEPAETETNRDYLTSFRRSFLVQPKGGGGQRTVSAAALPLRTERRN